MATSFVRLKYPFFIFAILAIVFAPLARGLFFGTGDIRDVFIPLELFFQHEFKAGRIPTWDPDISWGFPVLASAQIGFFYPVLYVARILPISLYLPLVLFLHFLALAYGLYLFLRRTVSNPLSAVLGALSFTLGMFVMQHITHLNIILTVAWLPWQLFIGELLSLKRRPPLFLIALFSLAAGLPFLVGQLQIPFFCAALACIYTMYRYYYNHRSLKSIIVSMCFIVVAVTGLAAAQVIPTIELVLFSSRGAGGNFDIMRANQHSFPLQQLTTIIFPRFYGSDSTYWGKRLEIEYGIFIGTLPLLLALGSIRYTLLKNPIYRFWLVVTGLGFLLALGDWSPVRLIGFEPSLWVFSAPARWLLFTTLGLSIVSTYGWDSFLQNPVPYKRFFKITFITLLSSVLIYNFIIFVLKPTAPQLLHLAQNVVTLHKENSYYLDKISILLTSMQSTGLSARSFYTYIPLLLLASAIFLTHHRKFVVVAVVLTIAELTFFAATTSPLVSWKTILNPPGTYALLPTSIKNKDARLASLRDGGDEGAIFTDPRTRPTPAKRAEQKNLLIPLVHAQFGVAGIEWPASLDLKSQYEVRNYFSLADLNIGALLVPKSFTQPGQVTLQSTYEDINMYTVPFENRVSVIDKNGSTVSSATASYQAISPTITRLTVSTNKPAEVVVRDTWYPGWSALRNNMVIPLAEYPPFFRTFSVPAGTSVTELHYQSTFLKKALYSSLLTGTLLSAVLVGSVLLQYKKKAY